MTKQEVISIINSDMSEAAKYGALTQALNKAPAKNLSLVNFYNRSGYTKSRFNTLVYDVKKAFGISKADLSAKPVKHLKPKITADSDDFEDYVQDLANIVFEDLNYHKELKPLAAKVAEATGDEPKSQKKADLIDFLEQKKLKPVTGQTGVKVESQPDSEKTAKPKRLDEMFPFLKRDDCPAKFKILVADKMIAYNIVQKNRQILIEDVKEPFLEADERLEHIQQTVECFEEDQVMFDELIHYQETKEVLGNHPLFKKERLQQEVNAMSGIEAFKAYKNLAPRISREKKKMRNAKSAESKKTIQKFVAELEMERKLLKSRIDSN